MCDYCILFSHFLYNFHCQIQENNVTIETACFKMSFSKSSASGCLSKFLYFQKITCDFCIIGLPKHQKKQSFEVSFAMLLHNINLNYFFKSYNNEYDLVRIISLQYSGVDVRLLYIIQKAKWCDYPDHENASWANVHTIYIEIYFVKELITGNSYEISFGLLKQHKTTESLHPSRFTQFWCRQVNDIMINECKNDNIL